MSNYVTAIGLDVHARSIKACALNPMTGEVERASFGYDPASVAEWALSFESPKAVYESGVNGFHLCRVLRALGLDCAPRPGEPAAARGRDARLPRRGPQRAVGHRHHGVQAALRGEVLPVARHHRLLRRQARRVVDRPAPHGAAGQLLARGGLRDAGTR